MNNFNYITIGIPFYNTEKYLEDAICSVLAQTHEFWELILVDDGSTDGSLNIAQYYAQKDSRIRVLSDGQNRKLPYRLNEIIKEASYDYIARMDADDLMSTTRLEKQINYLNAFSHLDLVSTGLMSLKNDLTLIGYRIPSLNKVITKSDAVMGTTGIAHATILAKTSWYKRNGYNENNRLAEDYELWLNAFINSDLKVGFIEEPLYYYREENNISLDKVLKAYDTQVKVIKMIQSTCLSYSKKIKYIFKFRAKSIIVRGLFLIGLDSAIHKRRVETKEMKRFERIFNSELKLINKKRLV